MDIDKVVILAFEFAMFLGGVGCVLLFTGMPTIAGGVLAMAGACGLIMFVAIITDIVKS